MTLEAKRRTGPPLALAHAASRPGLGYTDFHRYPVSSAQHHQFWP
jgi:hypothetical protein